MTQPRKAVSYYRVSQRLQALMRSDLEAQRGEVAAAAAREGFRIVGEHVDYENGARTPRTRLAKALAQCKTSEATLVVARLGALAKDWTFFMELHQAGVPVRILSPEGVAADGLLAEAIRLRAVDPRQFDPKAKPEDRGT